MKPLSAYAAKRCPLRIQLNIVEPGVPVPVAADVQMRIDAGNEFEDLIYGHLREHAAVDWVFVGEHDQVEATLQAIGDRAPVIVNGRFPSDHIEWRSGAPDVLVWAGDGYVPIDVKHHKTLNDGEGALVSALVEPFLDAATTTSHALRENKDDALQLAHYRRMLEGLDAAASSWAGIIGKEGVVVWYDLGALMWTTPAKSDGKKRKRRTSMEVYDFEFRIRRTWAGDAHRLLAGASAELLPPVRVSECGGCGWKPHCDETLEAGDGDASLLPGIGYRPWRRLHDAGVESRADVAALDYRTAQLSKDGVDLPGWLDLAGAADRDVAVGDLNRRAKKQIAALVDVGARTAGDILEVIDAATARLHPAGFLPEAILNARAATGPEPVYLRPGVADPQIPRADVELDIDMENTEDGVYLWGVLVTDRSGCELIEEGFVSFHSFEPMDENSEMAVFREFWDWLGELSVRAAAAGVSLKSYCWHESAENTQLRRIARRDEALLAEVEAFIDSGAWVDLEKTFKTQWITGGSTGLKAIAPLAGFEWDVDDPDGGMSMVRYLGAVAGSDEARKWLLAYNRGDVEATRDIREWLDSNVFQHVRSN